MTLPLKGGATRLLGKHQGKPGRAFRLCFDALGETFDLSTKLARLEASRVALAWVNVIEASQELQNLRRRRSTGSGRRPSVRDIERAARRQGLADASYSQALDKLRALVGTRPHIPSTPGALLTAMRPGADDA